MREYSKKDDVQRKSYYNDRFFASPTQDHFKVINDEIFYRDLQDLEKKCKIKKSYICHTHLVLEISKDEVVTKFPYDTKSEIVTTNDLLENEKEIIA